MALATIATIAAGLLKGGVLQGWFGGGEEWIEDVLGNQYSTRGSVLDELEDQTGKTYPALRKELDGVVTTHKQIKECWFWSKAAKIKSYQEKTAAFAQHVADEWAAYQATLGGLPGLENIIKSPIVIAVGVVVLILVVVLVAMTGRR